MLQVRVFPTLLLKGNGLWKTVKFKQPRYVGDPLNAVRIFNQKEVDELLLLDIGATPEQSGPRLDLISKISDECFMPLTVGGGIDSVDTVRELLGAGVEKVSINTAAVGHPELVEACANEFGSQSVVVAIDAARKWGGSYRVHTHGGRQRTRIDPVAHALEMEQAGAGEILINSIERDGTQAGFDLELTRAVADAVSVPVIASGGAGSVEHLAEAVEQGGASAVTAGSLFVFHGRRKAVLINFPSAEELASVVQPA